MSLFETLRPGCKTSPGKGTLEENVRLSLLTHNHYRLSSLIHFITMFSLEADGKSIKMDEKQGI